MSDTYSFNWSFVSNGKPRVTLSRLGIAFNVSAIELLGCPDYVVLGYDEEHGVIGVKKNDGDKRTARRFKGGLRNGFVRVGCMEFIRYLGMDKKSVRLEAGFDRETKTLLIDVSKQRAQRGARW